MHEGLSKRIAMQMDRFISLCPKTASRQTVLIVFMTVLSLSYQQSFVQAQTSIEQSKIDVPARRSSSGDDATLLDQLSKGRYSSRQRATLEMWGSRDELREQVQTAARDSNPEVAGRAKWILDQWRRGTTPNMPPRLMRLLQRGDDPSAIVELIELGRFDDAVVAVEESQATIEFQQVQNRVSSAITSRFPFYVEMALEDETFAALLKLIDLAATTKEMAVCRVRLLQRFGNEVDEQNLLPSSSKSWTPRQRDAAKVAILAVMGDYDGAVSAARQSADENLLRASLMLSSDWQELADRSIERAESEREPKELEAGKPMVLATVSHWVNALVAADRCGDRKSKAKSVAVLSAVQPTHEGFSLAWKALSLHGEMDLVFEMLDDASPEVITDVALAASRAEIVFDRLNFPLDQLDLELQNWIDDAIEKQLVEMPVVNTPPRGVQGRKQRANYPASPNLPVRKILSLMKCLIAVGRFDAAWEIASQLSDETFLYGKSPNTTSVRDVVLSRLAASDRKDWVIRLAAPDGTRSLSNSALSAVSVVLPDVESATFSGLVNALGKMHRLTPFDQRVRMAYSLCEGKIPTGFDSQSGFDALYKILASGKSSDGYDRVLRGSRYSSISRDWVSFFASHGQPTLATQCLMDLIRRGDLESLHDAAMHEVSSGNIDRSEQYFAAIWDRVKENGRRLASSGYQDESIVIAAKALIGRWMNAKRIGDVPLAEQLRTAIELSLCSPSTEFLDAIADVLVEYGDDEMAQSVYEVLLPLTALGSPEVIEFYDVARKYSILIRDKDADSAIRWFDLAVGGTLESTYFRSSAYVSLPLYIRRWSLEAAIDSRDQSAAREHLKRLVRLDPLDITSAEELMPKLAEAGMKSTANEAFDQLFDRGMAHCKRFPFDVTMGNNVAWVAAMNNRRLEEALVLSEGTVFVEPDSAIYRDTLAEILFRLGRKKQALHVEQACLLDDPMQWHLHQQVEKYRDAVSDQTVTQSP